MSTGPTSAIPAEVRDRALRAVELYCTRKFPDEVRDQMRLEVKVRGRAITIVERRPPWCQDPGLKWTSSPVAQFRFDPRSTEWSLHYPDSNSRWHRDEYVPAVAEIGMLLAAVENDPTGIYWG